MSNSERATYRAVQAVAPGKLELTELPLTAPGRGHVRIRVEACGVCHSDAATVEGIFSIAWPRVPGHEAVGIIDMLGEGVDGWAVGQRVGIGFLSGSCGRCKQCRAGKLVHCENQGFTGVQHDGGYAEVLIAKASGLMSIPNDLASIDAAPLLCAGLTTFSGLRNTSAKAGDLVAILGIGGLGHLAVQYARHMGFEVAAIGRGSEKAELAKKLGAHHYINSEDHDLGEALLKLGGATLVVSTASGGQALAQCVAGLAPGGILLTLGATSEPLGSSANDLIFGNKSIAGALTGDTATGEITLKFSSMSGISAMIETMPLERAAEAYAKMMTGQVRFRMVLTMNI